MPGGLGLASANLAVQAMRLLFGAKERSAMSQKDLAARLGVTEGRVSQVFRSDGNIRIATLARFMRAMGYAIQLVAVPADAPTRSLSSPEKRGRPRRRGRTAAAAGGYDLYEQMFLTGDGPMTFQMFVPADDVLGCVPHGEPQFVDRLIVSRGRGKSNAPHPVPIRQAEWQTEPIRPSISSGGGKS
ncbi:MAG TPA: helix-turn-helix transcriptional regulator [Rugosimonospora sp.]|nr:helix-turn-helix transcriptional regulator [Rugosimonospora sp.]